MNIKQYIAEFVGTFWLILLGCGSFIIVLDLVGSSLAPVVFAFSLGLTMVSLFYLLGPISGCHLNPAVTIGFAITGKLRLRDTLGYIIAQLIGAVLAATIVYGLASSSLSFGFSNSFLANGYGVNSPGGYSLLVVFITEVLATMFFMMIFWGVSLGRQSATLAGVAIGFGLFVAVLFAFNVSQAGLNPARSIATALFAPTWALQQLWLFIFAPLVGSILGAGLSSYLSS